MPLSLKPLMEDIIQYHDSNDNFFGYLPVMVGCSNCQLGAFNSQSFSERINSAVNQINTKDRLRMYSDLIYKLVTIRMNKFHGICARKCIQRGHYANSWF